MIIKNKARVNAFYFYCLAPRSLSRKTHGASLYAKLAKYSETAVKQTPDFMNNSTTPYNFKDYEYFDIKEIVKNF